jgi:hypothetical protein
MVKDGKASNHTFSNYQIQERLLMGNDLDWERHAVVSVGRVSRIIQSTIKKDKSEEESSEETGSVAGNKRKRSVPESQ